MSRPFGERYVNPWQYEQDRQLGIVQDPDAGRVRHAEAYEGCPRGPRCPFPVRCCSGCLRHAPGGHRECGPGH